MKRRVLLASLGLVIVAAAARTSAQTPGAGHWTGAIDVPGQSLAIEVDLEPGAPAWQGTITIPAQKLVGFPLASIEVAGTAVGFKIPRIPGDPTFKGELSDNGATMLGDFTQGELKTTFTLKRTGEARIAPPAKSTPITKDLEGDWTGTLTIGEQTLRLNLKLANAAEGATGTLVSVDQGGAEIPISTIAQNGTHIELSLPEIGGKYAGDIKEGRLVGTWTQGPGSFPLEFARPATP